MSGRLLATAVALALLALGTPEASADVHLVIIEPTGSLDFGTVEAFATSAPQRITIRNLGDTEPIISDPYITSPSFLLVGQGGSLAPGNSMYWDIVAYPEPQDVLPGASAYFELLWWDLFDDDSGSVSAHLTSAVTPSPYDAALQELGSVALGNSHTRTFPVTNTSTTPRQIAALSVASGPFTAQLHGGALPITVAPGASFLVDVTFTPTAPGFHWPHLVIADGTGPHGACRVTAHGALSTVAIAPSTFAFADTFRHPSDPPTFLVQLTNTGTAGVPVPAATITGAAFTLVSSPPPGLIQPQAAVSYVVAFAPPAAGTFAGQLVLGSLGTVPLSGKGVLRPVSAAAVLDLGTAFVGSAVQRSLSLHNAGTQAITVSSLALGDPRFRVVSADRTIPPLGNLALVLEYAPITAGEDLTELAIALDGDPDPQLSIALRGRGIVLDEPTDPTPIDPPIFFAPGAASSGEARASGGCATGAGAAPLAAALALLPLLRRRRRRPRRHDQRDEAG